MTTTGNKEGLESWYLQVQNFFFDFVGKHVLAISIITCIIICFISIKFCDAETTVAYCGATIAGCSAFYQWYAGRSVKRAELLGSLLEKLQKYKIQDLLTTGSKNENSFDNRHDDARLLDLLSFLSYLCYLRDTLVLSDNEFFAIRYEIIRVLENWDICQLIASAFQSENDKCDKQRPYTNLVEFGCLNCNPDMAEKYKLMKRGMPWDMCQQAYKQTDVISNQRTNVIDQVGSNKEYATHLDVLNGIFKLGYRAHMRGGARLPSGELVWFPKIYESKDDRTQKDVWCNVMEGDNLIEYCPSDSYHKKNDEPFNRIVFGKRMSDNNSKYKFMGVFEYIDSNDDEKYHRYQRKKSELLEPDVRRQ